MAERNQGGIAPRGVALPEQPGALPLETLYRTEAPRLLRMLRQRLSGPDEPSDLLHEAFARLASTRSRGLLRNPEAYLQRILRNLLVDRSRKLAARIEHVAIEPDLDLPVPPTQHEAIEAEELRQQFRAAVDGLPGRTREVFLLHRVDDLPYKMIAERLGISVRTVEWHIGEALIRIGQALDAA